MGDTRYSLCVTYPNINNHGQYLFFRVADYDTESQCLTKASFNQVDDEYNVLSIEPKIIGDRRREATANMVGIRSWEILEEDNRRSVSYSYPGTVYEVIFPKELENVDRNDINKVREILFGGIEIDENAGNDLLIVIENLDSQYAVLHCRKKDLMFSGGMYRVSPNRTDMLHSIHYLNKYSIDNRDIISTQSLEIDLLDGTAAPTRYFYQFTNLPSSDSKFQLYEFSSYIPQLISKYLKKKKAILQFSENEIKKIVSCIEEILQDNMQAKDYLETTGYGLTNLEEILPKYSNEIISELLCNSDSDKVISNYMHKSERIWLRCIEIMREQWLSEKNEERNEILTSLNEVECERDNLFSEVQKMKEERNKLETEIKQFEIECDDALKRLAKTNTEINDELKRFSEDIVHNVALASFIKQISGGTVENNSPILVYDSLVQYSEQCAEITDKDDLEEALAENLTVCGFSELKSFEIAQLISHCAIQEKPLIVNTYNGMIIANCLSTLVCGLGATVINIPMGYNLLTDIMSKIKGASSKVVYITGVFDGFHENIFHTIKSACGSKILFLSTDGADISFLTSSVWSDAYCIDGDEDFDYCGEEILTISRMDRLGPKPTYSTEDIKKKKKLLKPFIDSDIISNTVAVQYSKYMVDINSDVKSDWHLLLQLCLNAKSKHKTEMLHDIFETLGVDDKMSSSLLKYM